MRVYIFAILITGQILQSCASNNTTKEYEQSQNQIKKDIQEITDEAQHIANQREKEKLEKIKLIIQNIDRYMPIKTQYNSRLFGGIKNGLIFIENNTGYDVSEVEVFVEVTTDNEDVIVTTVPITFSNLPNGNSQSKPIDDTENGVKLKARIISITSEYLTGGEKINL